MHAAHSCLLARRLSRVSTWGLLLPKPRRTIWLAQGLHSGSNVLRGARGSSQRPTPATGVHRRQALQHGVLHGPEQHVLPVQASTLDCLCLSHLGVATHPARVAPRRMYRSALRSQTRSSLTPTHAQIHSFIHTYTFTLNYTHLLYTINTSETHICNNTLLPDKSRPRLSTVFVLSSNTAKCVSLAPAPSSASSSSSASGRRHTGVLLPRAVRSQQRRPRHTKQTGVSHS